jgi:hypothetical protein
MMQYSKLDILSITIIVSKKIRSTTVAHGDERKYKSNLYFNFNEAKGYLFSNALVSIADIAHISTVI